MIEHSKTGTMFTGDGVKTFRMVTQLSALKLKAKCGMELRSGFSICKQIKQEYGLKGNAAKLLELFAPMVEAVKAKQLHVVEIDAKPAKVEPLALDKKPDFVYWPVEAAEKGWKLGKSVPDQKGYYPSLLFVEGNILAAEDYCEKEAAGRGISKEQVCAAVGSSMFPANYFHQLTSALAHKAKAKKGGRRGIKRAN